MINVKEKIKCKAQDVKEVVSNKRHNTVEVLANRETNEVILKEYKLSGNAEIRIKANEFDTLLDLLKEAMTQATA